jgi:hypothetical protein
MSRQVNKDRQWGNVEECMALSVVVIDGGGNKVLSAQGVGRDVDIHKNATADG